MKTTLDLPEELLNDAMRLCGAKTKRATVVTALEQMRRRESAQELANRLGDSDTFMTADTLEAMRLRETPQ